MKEEIKFLKELQDELKYQSEYDYDSQASPRFWTIMDYRTVPTHPEYGMERMSYYHNDGDHTEFETIAELKEYLTDYYLDDSKDDLLANLIADPDASLDGLWEYVTYFLNDDGYFDECPVKEEEFIAPNTMFLTKEEAKNHLRVNHYHYSSKAHTYAMTAWRAPKVAKLLDILETFDWDSVGDDTNGMG
ncbi:hypothetical protein JOC34_000597 [Virgibacillus halotolerans]|uniref:hypothetical protein n=1 Tax=Virgibacillus halotolerans TaxID=1071053 RepID=UPI001960250A|nr:hypothetical protein [Virgibacillus halotolerans]MBM7598240.1 hypothetical protein [Virgibacillus halotolerans]